MSALWPIADFRDRNVWSAGRRRRTPLARRGSEWYTPNMHALNRFLVLVAAMCTFVIFVGLTLYLTVKFSTWWPTVFRIGGSLHLTLSVVTFAGLAYWLRFYEWPNFYAWIRRRLGMGMDR